VWITPLETVLVSFSFKHLLLTHTPITETSEPVRQRSYLWATDIFQDMCWNLYFSVILRVSNKAVKVRVEPMFSSQSCPQRVFIHSTMDFTTTTGFGDSLSNENKWNKWKSAIVWFELRTLWLKCNALSPEPLRQWRWWAFSTGLRALCAVKWWITLANMGIEQRLSSLKKRQLSTENAVILWCYDVVMLWRCDAMMFFKVI